MSIMQKQVSKTKNATITNSLLTISTIDQDIDTILDYRTAIIYKTDKKIQISNLMFSDDKEKKNMVKIHFRFQL